MTERSATCTAPVNIAAIKYWGKRDDKLILPVNSSLSLTLNQSDLKTQTTIVLSSKFDRDRIWLNGVEEDIMNDRLQNCLSAIRARAADYLRACRVHIYSKNNFPTAAGLASSAAGYACLAFTLAQVFDVKESFPGELSILARVGSGSACRSLYGGFVRWSRGQRADGLDSFASQVAPASHWPEICILVLVVSDNKKENSSTSGQETSVQTSALLAYRAAELVEPRMQAIEKAILARDFPTFAELTMRDSNQFHAVCLDTYPPIFYMNDTSRAVVRLITNFNRLNDGVARAAYTFDAGPNAVIFVERRNVGELAAAIRRAFPPAHGVVADAYFGAYRDAAMSDDEFKRLAFAPQPPGSLKYIISTSVGDGPHVVATPPDLDKEYPLVVPSK